MTAPLSPDRPIAWWVAFGKRWAELHAKDRRASFFAFCQAEGFLTDSHARAKLKSLGFRVNRRRCPTGR